VDGQQEGFRVPALLISPLVRAGYVSHRQYDDSSVPAIISRTFKLNGAAGGPDPLAGVWAPHVRQVPLLAATPTKPYEAIGRTHSRAVWLTYVIGMLIAAATLAVFAVPQRSLRRFRS
jgi:hypothetical protein